MRGRFTWCVGQTSSPQPRGMLRARRQSQSHGSVCSTTTKSPRAGPDPQSPGTLVVPILKAVRASRHGVAHQLPAVGTGDQAEEVSETRADLPGLPAAVVYSESRTRVNEVGVPVAASTALVAHLLDVVRLPARVAATVAPAWPPLLAQLQLADGTGRHLEPHDAPVVPLGLALGANRAVRDELATHSAAGDDVPGVR